MPKKNYNENNRNELVINFLARIDARDLSSKQEIKETIEALRERKKGKLVNVIPNDLQYNAKIYDVFAVIFANHPQDLLNDANKTLIEEIENTLENRYAPSPKSFKRS